MTSTHARPRSPARKFRQVAEFDPRQLDQLEDALEHLDDHDLSDHESLDLPAELVERLSEYQDVLALCRDAFPLESPPDELLTGVIAEAREVSGRPRVRDAGQRGNWRRFWERWRGTVVPGFALATTAVVMLWVLDPDAQLESASELSSATELDDGSVEADLERTQPAGESSNETSDVAKSDEPDQPKSEQPGQADQPEIEAPDPTAAKQAPDTSEASERTEPKPSAAGKPPTKSKLDDSYDHAPEPTPTPMSKDETWTSLERADSARRAGNCDRARTLYDDVIAASSDALAIAQAKGGIGLCFEQDRRDTEAAKWFDDARAASPGIDAWINGQRDEQPLPGESKKPTSKKAAPLEADAL